MPSATQGANVQTDSLKIAQVGLKGIPAKWGGIERYVEEIGKRLAQRGHEIIVFASNWYCKDYPDNFYEGMRIVRVPSVHLLSTDALSNALLSLGRIIHESFDIVHLHGYASYYCIPVLKRAGKKTVVTTHGMESGWDNPKYGNIAKRIIQNAFRIGIRQAHCVTTVADHLQKRINDQYQINALVTYSGIDNVSSASPHLISKAYGLLGNDYLLYLGRIDQIKNIEWIVKLANLVGRNIKIVIAGGPQDASSTAYYKNLKSMVNHDASCIFTGMVAGKLKTELISNCLAFVTASQNEGLPVALLEAAAMGKIPIASDIAAHKEVIDNGVSGFLFDKHDLDELVKKVMYFVSMSKEERGRISMNLKQQISTKFNWDRTTDLFENAYQNIKNGKK